MLEITIPEQESWDEINQEFIYTKEQTLRLEHSLVSLSKWESKWHKSYFSKKEKTDEETIDYIRCMTLTKNVDSDIYYHLGLFNINKINEYIEDPMSATKIYDSDDSKGKIGGETVTSELIYYWMITLNIPVEFEKWHLNRLITLIKVCNMKNAPKKKMSRSEIMKRNRELNKARRKQLNSKG